MRKRRTYGTGSVYRPRNKRVWMLKYYVSGKPVRESSGTRNRKEALDVLKRRIEASRARRVAPAARVKFEDLATLLREYNQKQGRASAADTSRRIDHLSRTFAGKRMAYVEPQDIAAFVRSRVTEGASPSETNRELAVLRRLYHHGRAMGVIDWCPTLAPHWLPEPEPRTGFFEESEILSVLARLPPYLRPPIRFAYSTGWRRSEVFGMRWSWVDLPNRSITIPKGFAKNRQARHIKLRGDLLALIETQSHDRGHFPACEFVFHRAGREIRDPNYAWRKACEEAGLPGKLIHDLRRTAARNMIRSGTPENVVMKLLGHKTRSMLTRYDIVDERDLDEAAQRQEQYQRQLDRRAASMGTHSGTSAGNPEEGPGKSSHLH